jgi:ABC-type dipeptide/oligopeptide/nickel transport system ATPase component
VLDAGVIVECISVAQIQQARHPATLALLRSLPVPVEVMLSHLRAGSICDAVNKKHEGNASRHDPLSGNSRAEEDQPMYLQSLIESTAAE